MKTTQYRTPTLLIGLFVFVTVGLFVALLSVQNSQDIRQQAASEILDTPIELQHSPENPIPGEPVTVDLYFNSNGYGVHSLEVQFDVLTSGESGQFEINPQSGFKTDYLDIKQSTEGYTVVIHASPEGDALSTIDQIPFGSFTFTPIEIESTEVVFTRANVELTEPSQDDQQDDQDDDDDDDDDDDNKPFKLDILDKISDYLVVVGDNSSCQPRPDCLDAQPACQVPVPPGGWCENQCIPLPECALPGANPACTLAEPPSGQEYCPVPLNHVQSCNPSPEEIASDWQNSTEINNPYFPLPVGLVNVLEGEGETVRFTVTPQIKLINGVNTRVIEEYETAEGVLKEISHNYFAQAPDGTVCYFGEDVDIYANGVVVSNDGTWHAGQDGNKAGILMPATPEAGQHFRIEDAPSITIEEADITSVNTVVSTPVKDFSDTVNVKEQYSGEVTLKDYAKGVGLIRDNEMLLVSTTSPATPPATSPPSAAPTTLPSISPTSIPNPSCVPLPDCALPGANPACSISLLEGFQFCPLPTAIPDPTCQPRPLCLDSEPACQIPVPTIGWCEDQCVPLPDCALPGANPACSFDLPPNRKLCPAPLNHELTCNPTPAQIASHWQNSTEITNPHLPLPVGLVNLLEGDGESVRFTVTPQTKVINGVNTRVIEEYETSLGVLKEISYNYFAQGPDGTVCYFGEDVDIYANGVVVSNDGTWYAGQDGNKAGIVMPSNPQTGQHFRIEDAPNVTIEEADITSINKLVSTPAKDFTETVNVKEQYSGEVTFKDYAKGVGLVRDNEMLLVSSTALGSNQSNVTIRPELVLSESITDQEVVLTESPFDGPFFIQLIGSEPVKVLFSFGEKVKNLFDLSVKNEQLIIKDGNDDVARVTFALGRQCANPQVSNGLRSADFDLALDKNGVLIVSGPENSYLSPNYTYLLDYQIEEGSEVELKSFAFETRENTPFLTDITGDGIVDIDDYSILSGEFFSTKSDYFFADFDCNGIVDIDDYTIMTSELFQVTESK